MAQVIEVLQGGQPVNVEFPDDMSLDDIAEALQGFPTDSAAGQTFAPVEPIVEPPESTVFEELQRGFSRLGVDFNAFAQSFSNPEEAALEALKKQAEVSQRLGKPPSLEDTVQAYKDEGVIGAAGEILTDIPRITAQQLPTTATVLGGTALGTAALGPLGGIAGGYAALYPQLYSQNIQRQAEADIQAGREVDINRTKAALAAVAQTGAEQAATYFTFGKGLVSRLLGLRPSQLTPRSSSALVNIARDSLGGVARGAAIEMPTEVAQQVIERAQADLDVLSDEALTEYGEAGYMAAIAGGTIGGVSGAASPIFTPTTVEQPGQLPTTEDLSEITQTEDIVTPDLPTTEPTPDLSEDTTLPPLEERLSLIAPNLRGTLKGRGLDDVGLELSTRLDPKALQGMRDPDEVDAIFDPDLNTIFLGADRIKGFEQMDTPQLQREFGGLVDHEMVHAVKRMNLWKDSEWKVLENAARRRTNAEGRTYMDAAISDYNQETAEIQTEEAVAELIRDTLSGRTGLAGQPLSLIQRFVEFFRKMGNALTGTGYASFNQVVNDIETGVTGGRPRVAQPEAEATIIGEPAVASRGLANQARNKRGNPLGINVRQDKDGTDYASLIASGQKAYESRESRSLDPYVGKRVGLVRTGAGPASLVGYAEVGTPIEANESTFNELREEHLVPKGSTFDIKEGQTKFLYPMLNAESVAPQELPSSYRGNVARAIGEPLASRRALRQDDNRLQQAKDQGRFNTDRVLYHFTDKFQFGGKEFESIIPSVAGKLGPGIYTSPDAAYSQNYLKSPEIRGSRGIAGYARGPIANQSDYQAAIDFAVDDYRSRTDDPINNVQVKRLAKEILEEQGFTGLEMEFPRGTEVVVFNPKDFRSINAEFDPRATDSTRLLASRGRKKKVEDLAKLAKQKAEARSAGSKVKIEDIATALDEDHMSNYGRKLDPTVTEDQLLAADVIAQDIKQQMTNDISGQGWYDADVEKTFMLLSQIPGLESLATNEDHRVIWSALAAPTSIGQKVGNNTRAATAAMLGYLRTGKIPTTPPAPKSVTEGIPNAGWGFKQKSVGSGMKVISTLVDKYGEAGFADWWLSPHPLSELTAIRKEAGLSGAPTGLSGGKDSIHLGAMSIGDKTGRFSLNINGYEGTTKDVWYSRSYNRAFGQMFGNTGEVQGGPRNQTERRQMEDFNRLVLDKIKEEQLSEADAQAILWFHEQNLYTELGVLSRAESFSEGVEALYDNFGIRQTILGGDESQVGIEPTNALEGFRSISPEQRAERDRARQESEKLKTKPGDSAALAVDQSKAATEVRGNPEADQAAAAELQKTKKLASRSKASDIVTSTAYNRVADVASKRAARGQGNINNALPFEAPSSADDRGIVYQLQDKYIDLKNATEAIKANQRNRGLTPLKDIENPYLGEESMHGIIGNKFNRFQQDEVTPLAKKLVATKIPRKELEEFLVLRHAIERNENVRNLNAASKNPRPELADGGAGSLNGQRLVDSYVKSEMQNKYGLRWNDSTKSWEGGNRRAGLLNDLAADFDAITRGTLQELKDSGLINQDSLDKLNTHYKYYAPLRGVSPDEDIAIEEHSRIARGANNLSIGGIETEKATGRVSEAMPPLGQIIFQRQNAIRRGTINDVVGQRMLNVIREHPNDNYWKIHEDRSYAGVAGNELFGVKEDGKQYFVEFKDKRLRDAMLSLDAAQTGKILGFLRGVNRYMSAVLTSYNPDFVAPNFVRDLGTAINNLVGEQTMVGGKAVDTDGLIGKVIADVGPSVREVYRGLRGKKLNKKLEQDWKDYMESGAKTEWFHVKSPEESSRDIDDLIAMAQGTFKGNIKAGKDAIAGFVSDVNGAIENGVRFATFKNARDLFIENGDSRAEAVAKAATLAKNLTVNFNRKGNSGELLNGLYLFFNASVQGTANFLRGMSSPAKQRMLLAMASFGSLITYLNEMVSEEDEDGKSVYANLPSYVKERNLVLMKNLNPFYEGKGDDPYTIPLPYGYNVLHVLGVNTMETILGLISPQDAAARVTASALGSFSPVGFGTSSNPVTFAAKGLTPQIGKPIAEILLNEDFFGSPVYTEPFDFGPQIPLANLSQRSTPEAFKQTTRFLNELTGGNESRGGEIIDLGWVSPDALHHLVGTFIGGTGRFAERLGKTSAAGSDYLQGEYVEGDLSINDVPILRRFMYESTGLEGMSTYYDRKDDILAADRQAGLLRGSERGEFIRENRPLLLMKRMMESSDKRIRNINRRLAVIGEKILTSPSIEATIKLEEEQKRLEDLKLNAYNRFNKRFNERVGPTK